MRLVGPRDDSNETRMCVDGCALLQGGCFVSLRRTLRIRSRGVNVPVNVPVNVNTGREFVWEAYMCVW